MEQKKRTSSSIICSCFELSLDDFSDQLGENVTFDQVLNKTKAGSRCTACMLDLEYYFETLPRKKIVGEGKKAVIKNKVPLRRKFLKFIDSITPLLSYNLHCVTPIIFGEKINTQLMVSNQKLLFKKDSVSSVKLKVKLRNNKGLVCKELIETIKPGENFKHDISQYFVGQDLSYNFNGTSIGIGSYEIVRSWLRPGIRGMTRPHFVISGNGGATSLHTGAGGGPSKNWFSILPCNSDNFPMLSIINSSNRDLEAVVDFPSTPKLVSQKQSKYIVPPYGTILLNLSELLTTDMIDKNTIISGCLTVTGASKVHLIIASKNFDCFSMDHFSQ